MHSGLLNRQVLGDVFERLATRSGLPNRQVLGDVFERLATHSGLPNRQVLGNVLKVFWPHIVGFQMVGFGRYFWKCGHT